MTLVAATFASAFDRAYTDTYASPVPGAPTGVYTDNGFDLMLDRASVVEDYPGLDLGREPMRLGDRMLHACDGFGWADSLDQFLADIVPHLVADERCFVAAVRVGGADGARWHKEGPYFGRDPEGPQFEHVADEDPDRFDPEALVRFRVVEVKDPRR